MRIVAQFDPTITANDSGTINAQLPGGGGLLKMVVINQSTANMVFTFPNGDSDYVLAQDRRLFVRSLPSGNIGWSVQSFIGDTIFGVSQVTCVLYDPSEAIPEQYPAAIVQSAFPNWSQATNPLVVNPSVFLVGKTKRRTFLQSFIWTSQLAAAKANVLISVTAGANAFNFNTYESDVEAVTFRYIYDFPLQSNGVNSRITVTVSGASALSSLSLVGYWQ